MRTTCGHQRYLSLLLQVIAIIICISITHGNGVVATTSQITVKGDTAAVRFVVTGSSTNVNITRDATLAAPVIHGNLVVDGMVYINAANASGLVNHLYSDGTLIDAIRGSSATTSTHSGAPPTSIASISAFGPNGHVVYPFSISGASFESDGVTSQYTIATWIRTTDNAGQGNFVMGWRTGSGDTGLFLRYNGTPYMDETSVGSVELYSPFVINDGTWHHVAITHGGMSGDASGTGWRVIADGKAIAGADNSQQSQSKVPTLDETSFTIGDKEVSGDFADIRVYDRVLSLKELNQLYQATQPMY